MHPKPQLNWLSPSLNTGERSSKKNPNFTVINAWTKTSDRESHQKNKV